MIEFTDIERALDKAMRRRIREAFRYFEMERKTDNQKMDGLLRSEIDHALDCHDRAYKIAMVAWGNRRTS